MSIFLGERTIKKRSKKIDTSSFFKKDGSTTMENNLDMNQYAIIRLKTNPDHNTDATSKKYVDDEMIKRLSLDGGTLKGPLNMGLQQITNIGTPTSTRDAATKRYVDEKVKSTQDDVDINSKIIQKNSNRHLTLSNDVLALQNAKKYVHVVEYSYSNPVSTVAKEPHIFPGGYPLGLYVFTSDYKDTTKLVLKSIMVDSDLSGPIVSTASIKIDLKCYLSDGTTTTHTFLPTQRLNTFRINNNLFHFTTIQSLFKNLDSTYNQWIAFYPIVTTSWSGNETRVLFYVEY